jgi:hypothetical protein
MIELHGWASRRRGVEASRRRGVGARDLVLGAGLLAEPAGGTRWVRAGVAADAGDTVGSLPALGPIPATKLVPGTVLAAAYVAAGLWLESAERRGSRTTTGISRPVRRW